MDEFINDRLKQLAYSALALGMAILGTVASAKLLVAMESELWWRIVAIIFLPLNAVTVALFAPRVMRDSQRYIDGTEE